MENSLSPWHTAPGVSPEELHALAQEVFRDQRLIIVSNREPYEHVHTKDGIRARKTLGGLVSALDPMMQAVGGVWIAWGSGSADRDVVDGEDRVLVPPGKPAYPLRRVWLSEEEVEKYYEGHANQTLWPLCHLETEKVRFFRSEWDAYQSVNRRFAEAAFTEISGTRGVVWFHDYHFATAPGMLRDLHPEMTILQFWHIPWPPWEVFRQHPQRHAILEGMLGCDLIGMHITLFCHNFLECVERELGIPVDFAKQHVVMGNRTVRVRAFPISVDVGEIRKMAISAGVSQAMDRIRGKLPPGVRIGIGVDRSDYTKGILLKLRALELLFERYPRWREKFSFIQVTPPSREGIRAYSLFRMELRRLIRGINARFGTGVWQPIIHIQTARTLRELIALYRIADVAIVSARQDGMNLVAKEFVASRSDEQGVLILSEFTGVAEEMSQALLINPYDMESFSHAIHCALTMTSTEQRTRMRQLRHHLFCNTIHDWVASVFEEIDLLHKGDLRSPMRLLDHLDTVEETLKRTPHTELFCDYDGVLTPIAPRPQDARIDDTMRDLLTKFRDSGSVHVCIISGRSLADITEMISVERLTYAGNHGLEISGPRVERMHPDAERVHTVLRRLYEDLRRAMRPYPGVIVEDKQLGIAVHYRLADPIQVPDVVALFYECMEERNRDDLLRATTGNAVLEVHPNVEWDKGRAVLWLLSELHGPSWQGQVLPIYLGDDETDEDAFRALRKSGITIRVGPRNDRSAAQYTLDDTGDVAVFLTWLSRVLH